MKRNQHPDHPLNRRAIRATVTSREAEDAIVVAAEVAAEAPEAAEVEVVEVVVAATVTRISPSSSRQGRSPPMT